MSVIPEHFEDILRAKTVAHIATVGPKGDPQVSPILFDWDGIYIRFGMNVIRQKHRNILREPRIALSIIDPSNMYRSIEIRGKVVRIEEDVDFCFINTISQKYLNRDSTPEENPPESKRVVLTIEPERAFVFPSQESKK